MNPLDFVERLFSNIGSVFSRIGYLYQQGSDTAKKPWLRQQLGDASLGLMRQIKRTLDPDGLLNPGKMFD